MGGGLIQLVAYGSQDIYLTSNPQITFFKTVYRRHTNFAREISSQNVIGACVLGNKVSVTINRDADLIKKIWIQYSPADVLSSIPYGEYVAANFGHSLIDYVEIEIGGQLIDRHYGIWLTIWNYLTEPNPTGIQGKGNGSYGNSEPCSDNNYYTQDTNVSIKYQTMSFNHRAYLASGGDILPDEAYIPLQFWFCRNPGLAIPLIALQYHEVKLNILFQKNEYMTTHTLPSDCLKSVKVFCEYIYLDTTERRQFAQNTHEYLIEQVQVNKSATGANLTLLFNHPIKELIWCTTPIVTNKILGKFSGGSSPSSRLGEGTYTLLANNNQLFMERSLKYFTRNQVWDHHTGYGSVLYPDSIGVYSFALRPEEHQPSGTCNFSRIDTVQLLRNIPNKNEYINIYAVNYNLLRIMSGMGGLAYSN